MLSPKLRFDDLPQAIKAAWQQATAGDDPFGPVSTAHLSPGSQRMVLDATCAYLAWLTRTTSLPTDARPADVITADGVKDWLDSRPSLAPATCYTVANALKLFLDSVEPAADTRPLQDLANAYRRRVPRAEAWKLALPDQATVIDHGVTMVRTGTASPEPTLAEARHARDGLVIALLAWTPKRAEAVARLSIGVHLRYVDAQAVILVTPQKTKAISGPRPIPIPADIAVALDAYLARAWPVLTHQPAVALPDSRSIPPVGNRPADAPPGWGAPLWPAGPNSGRPRDRGMRADSLTNRISKVTAEEFGQVLPPGTFRHLVATDAGRREPDETVAQRLDHTSGGRVLRETYRATDRQGALRRAGGFGQRYRRRACC